MISPKDIPLQALQFMQPHKPMANILSFALLLQPYGKRNKQFCGINFPL